MNRIKAAWQVPADEPVVRADELRAWLKEKMEEAETERQRYMNTHGISAAGFWHGRYEAYAEILRWLDER